MSEAKEIKTGAVGRVVQVVGATVDAEFPEGRLPDLYNALVIDGTIGGESLHVVLEVQQHLGGNRVRAVSMVSTDWRV